MNSSLGNDQKKSIIFSQEKVNEKPDDLKSQNLQTQLNSNTTLQDNPFLAASQSNSNKNQSNASFNNTTSNNFTQSNIFTNNENVFNAKPSNNQSSSTNLNENNTMSSESLVQSNAQQNKSSLFQMAASSKNIFGNPSSTAPFSNQTNANTIFSDNHNPFAN